MVSAPTTPQKGLQLGERREVTPWLVASSGGEPFGAGHGDVCGIIGCPGHSVRL